MYSGGGFGGFGGFGGANDTSTGGGFLGGFFPSPQKNSGFISPSKRGDAAKVRDLQGIMPVTVKLLLEEGAIAGGETSSVRVHGDHEASLVELVGQVVAANLEQVFMKYTIDDGTGKICCKKYVDMDKVAGNMGSGGFNSLVGKFVRVVGPFRKFGSETSITAHRVDEITNLDEIARHRLDVMHTYLQLSGRMDSTGGAVSGAGSVHAITNPSQPDQAGLYPSMANAPPGPITTGYFLSEMSKTFGPRGPRFNSSVGVNRQQLQMHFAGQMTAKQVDEKLEHLRNEGLVFSTVDENHFQVTFS